MVKTYWNKHKKDLRYLLLRDNLKVFTSVGCAYKNFNEYMSAQSYLVTYLLLKSVYFQEHHKNFLKFWGWGLLFWQ